MALITLPSTAQFEAVEVFKLQRAGLTLRSRYTGRRQAVTFPFALWVFEGTLLPKVGTDAGKWRSFLVQLEGQKNTFKLPVPGHDRPLSGYSSNAALQTKGGVTTPAGASAVPVIYGPAGAAFLAEGDYFTINDELKVCTAAVAFNAQGEALLNFKPALRRPVNPFTVLTVFNPYMVMQDQEDGTGWGLTRPVQHGIKLKLMEAFD